MNIRSSGKWINLIRFPGFWSFWTKHEHFVHNLSCLHWFGFMRYEFNHPYTYRHIYTLKQQNFLLLQKQKHNPVMLRSLSVKSQRNIYWCNANNGLKLPFYARVSVERIELIACNANEVRAVFIAIKCYIVVIHRHWYRIDFILLVWWINKTLQPNKSHSSLNDNIFHRSPYVSRWIKVNRIVNWNCWYPVDKIKIRILLDKMRLLLNKIGSIW